MLHRVFAALSVCLAAAAWAKPPAADVFCVRYPTSPQCVGGRPACSYCHVAPPQRNVFGEALEAQLAPGAARPLSDGDFASALPGALAAVESADSDGDNVSNLLEIQKGTLPAERRSFPNDVPCAGGNNPQFKVCQYDVRYVYRKVLLDFCGYSPTFAMLKTFDALADDNARRAFIDTELDRCVTTDFWRGKHGVLWKLAHPKIRPVSSLKAGEDQGQIPLADYYDDYALFSYAHSDDHDVREVITADFFVQRTGSNPTQYNKVMSLASQAVDQAHRAGNMTSAWTLTYFVMFTALPRNAASQMYRAYLGLDIAKQEGLFSVANEPRDYDAKGVQAQACAACHATLDPLSYPYRNYNGISLNQYSNRYIPNRLELFFPNEAATISQTPEAGMLFGQPVATLRDWARVAADSDAFLVATTTDYWKLLMGHPPTAEENEAFVTSWRALKSTHNYRVRGLLHDLIRTEAYGAP